MSNHKNSIIPIAASSQTSAREYVSLLKIHLCLYIGLCAIFGHVMAAGNISALSFVTGFFVFTLAIGSAVLNNIQDRYYDRFFSRTENRSLPQKRIPLFHAKWLAAGLILSGLAGLLVFAPMVSVFYGVCAVIAYNGLYTPLKKKTLLAIIPGCLSGMLPALIGWSAAVQPAWNFDILMVMGILGLWQIPHTFIILLKAQKQNRVQSPYPCFSKIFSDMELRLQILIWTSLYSLAILAFLIDGPIQHAVPGMVCFFNAILIVFLMLQVLFKPNRIQQPLCFAAINFSMLVFMTAGICDTLL